MTFYLTGGTTVNDPYDNSKDDKAVLARLQTETGPAPWEPILLDLIELDEAGVLGGIRAIIAWRKRIAAGEVPALPSVTEPAMAMARWHGADGLAAAAALLAAEIDRTAGE